ncbi:MAG TPA: TetR/AcrR family transcriptional regulator [Rhizomicrobium sp.]|jgi:AcrR family transcriptional regulator|nr:TetR/AcrR family transcriptional regulator [Rhizomicrobium sp.]
MAPRKATTKTPRAYHKGNVSKDLVTVTTRILAEESVEALSVRRLAREVGVTPANFYNHFPSLEHLLLDVAAEGFDQMAENTRRYMQKAKTRKDGLVEACIGFVFFAIDNKQLFRIMFGQVPDATQHDRFRDASGAAFAQMVRLMYGEWRYDREHLMQTHHNAAAAYGLFSLIHGLARNIIDDQFEFETGSRTEIRQFCEDVVLTFVDGTGAKVMAGAG